MNLPIILLLVLEILVLVMVILIIFSMNLLRKFDRLKSLITFLGFLKESSFLYIISIVYTYTDDYSTEMIKSISILVWIVFEIRLLVFIIIIISYLDEGHRRLINVFSKIYKFFNFYTCYINDPNFGR